MGRNPQCLSAGRGEAPLLCIDPIAKTWGRPRATPSSRSLSSSLSLKHTHTLYTRVGQRQWREDQQAGNLLECWGEIKVLCFHYGCTLKIELRDYKERREVEKKHRYTFIYCRLYLDTHVECTCLAWEQNPPAEMRQQRSFDFSCTAAVALNWFCFKTHILQQIKWWHSAKAVYRTKTNKNVLNLNFKIYKCLQ